MKRSNSSGWSSRRDALDSTSKLETRRTKQVIHLDFFSMFVRLQLLRSSNTRKVFKVLKTTLSDYSFLMWILFVNPESKNGISSSSSNRIIASTFLSSGRYTGMTCLFHNPDSFFVILRLTLFTISVYISIQILIYYETLYCNALRFGLGQSVCTDNNDFQQQTILSALFDGTGYFVRTQRCCKIVWATCGKIHHVG